MNLNDENESNVDEPDSTQFDEDGENDDDFGDFEAMNEPEAEGHVDVPGKGTECLIESAFVQSAFNRISSLFRLEELDVPIHNTEPCLTTCQNLVDVMVSCADKFFIISLLKNRHSNSTSSFSLFCLDRYFRPTKRTIDRVYISTIAFVQTFRPYFYKRYSFQCLH